MSEIPGNTSEGTFRPKWYDVSISEEVIFPHDIVQLIGVETIVSQIAKMGDENPCSECQTIVDVIRNIAFQSGTEPQDMGHVGVLCYPDEHHVGLYEVQGAHEALKVLLKNVHCKLIPWMVEKLILKELTIEQYAALLKAQRTE